MFLDSYRMEMCWLKAKFPTDFFQCVKGRALSLPVDAITCSVSLLCKPECVETVFLLSLVGWGSLGIVASTPIVPLRNTFLRNRKIHERWFSSVLSFRGMFIAAPSS